ncbi:membrane-associated tyrosine- and threonine-specific cdc2-inhibitory kinase [Neosynchiropus ocellatus]
MSKAEDTPGLRSALPLPTHFSFAEQSFSAKKRRRPFSSSNSSISPVNQLSDSLPPLPPSKGWSVLSRLVPLNTSSYSPASSSLNESLTHSYASPSKQQSYFNQTFNNLGLLGRGSFGEVYKVQSNKDGQYYAVKRSAHRFRGSKDRNRSLREARNHEKLGRHPHILHFEASWEERGRLYIQTELCSTSLLNLAENQPPGSDEPAAWSYMCDLLSALDHLHSNGYVHLDLKPANVLVTESGRLKLGDFGLLLELDHKRPDLLQTKVKEEAQEGDGRYMAPELLRGEFGPAADVFSLGVSILELACNIEVPSGGEGWQQLRQGCLPAEFTGELSTELQSILKMMLSPDPSKRPTVSELLALPCVRKHRWKRRVHLTLAETALTLVSFCQAVLCFGSRILSSLHFSWLPRWNQPEPCTPPRNMCELDLTHVLATPQIKSDSSEDEAMFLSEPEPQLNTENVTSFLNRKLDPFLLDGTSTPLVGSSAPKCPVHSPIRLNVPDMSPFHLSKHSRLLPLTPKSSPIHNNSLNDSCPRSRHSCRSSQRRSRAWMLLEDDLPRSNFEPKNLMGLFQETAVGGSP